MCDGTREKKKGWCLQPTKIELCTKFNVSHAQHFNNNNKIFIIAHHDIQWHMVKKIKKIEYKLKNGNIEGGPRYKPPEVSRGSPVLHCSLTTK